MEALKQTIEAVIRTLETRHSREGQRSPEEILKKILTKSEFGHIRISYSTADTVYLYIDSSSVLYHLNLRKASILQKVRALNPDIKDIRLRLGDTNAKS
ncbi:MAG: hypothetical protein KBA46_02585 [Candidatus Omnitrophica bacterium]|nr:hypothetical protein [Candidatus Omnitrophota bacterium]